jgi:hypothetical protein
MSPHEAPRRSGYSAAHMINAPLHTHTWGVVRGLGTPENDPWISPSPGPPGPVSPLNLQGTMRALLLVNFLALGALAYTPDWARCVRSGFIFSNRSICLRSASTRARCRRGTTMQSSASSSIGAGPVCLSPICPHAPHTLAGVSSPVRISPAVLTLFCVQWPSPLTRSAKLWR